MITLNSDDVDAAFQAMCDAAQLPLDAQMDKNYRHQVIAFVLALRKNFEREQTYNGLWMEDNMRELGEHLVHKGKRMSIHEAHLGAPPNAVLSADRVEEATDDALDAINYGAFLARKAHYAALANGIDDKTHA